MNKLKKTKVRCKNDPQNHKWIHSDNTKGHKMTSSQKMTINCSYSWEVLTGISFLTHTHCSTEHLYVSHNVLACEIRAGHSLVKSFLLRVLLRQHFPLKQMWHFQFFTVHLHCAVLSCVTCEKRQLHTIIWPDWTWIVQTFSENHFQ